MCDIYALLFIPTVKYKILTMATVYETSTCLHALHVNTFLAVKLHLITTIGKNLHMENLHLPVVSGGTCTGT